MGQGGDLASSEVTSQLDVIVSEIEPVRELELGNTPYDGSNSRQHELALAERIGIVRDADAIKAEERALKRLGLLDDGDDLAALLESLYGQALPVAYLEDDGHLSVLESIDKLDASQRAEAAREFDRALADQTFGLEQHACRRQVTWRRGACGLRARTGRRHRQRCSTWSVGARQLGPRPTT